MLFVVNIKNTNKDKVNYKFLLQNLVFYLKFIVNFSQIYYNVYERIL